jgi:hypothetical protein
MSQQPHDATSTLAQLDTSEILRTLLDNYDDMLELIEHRLYESELTIQFLVRKIDLLYMEQQRLSFSMPSLGPSPDGANDALINASLTFGQS